MKGKGRYIRFLIISGVLILFVLPITGSILFYQFFLVDLPNIETLKDYHPCLVTQVFDEHGNVIGEFFKEKREIVPLERVPHILRKALIAAEDSNFYHHEGLDFIGIFRAMLKNIRAGGIVQGGSTITQQVVKSLLLTPERSIKRKIREAVLAYRLERSLSKDEILYLYINQIYFGHGAYGVQVASKSYFGHDVTEIGLAEAALLAGLPRAPSRYSPARNPELARERKNYVLHRMLEEGMILREEMLKAREKPVPVLPSKSSNTAIAPYFIDYVRQYLLKHYGQEKTYCGGMKVYTTLIQEEQLAAEEAIQFGFEAYRKRHQKEVAEEEGEEQKQDDNPIQGALLSMSLPDGAIRAMIGGRDYNQSEFNRAVQSRRQPGSAIKPLIYAAALDKGYTPATIIVDSPIVFNDPVLEGKWKPKNYSRYFVGPTTLRNALTHSRNVVTIKILRDIGVNYAIRYARKLGLKSELTPDLSLALGSSDVTLQELLVAYSVFAIQGARPVPKLMHRIDDRDGEILETFQPESEEVISPQTAYLMASLLRSVVQEGTGRSVRSLGVPCAGKTGTTNDYRDAWFIGFTPEKIVGVWMGYDQPQNLGSHESGGRVAAPVWLYHMKKVLKAGPNKAFSIPSGIVFAKIDTQTGLLATSRTKKNRLECFLEGTEPQAYSTEGQDQDETDFFREEFDSLIAPALPEDSEAPKPGR